MNERLTQDGKGGLVLVGHVLQAGDEVEVIVGGNWHRAIVLKNTGRVELILETGRSISGVGLIARLLEENKP